MKVFAGSFRSVTYSTAPEQFTYIASTFDITVPEAPDRATGTRVITSETLYRARRLKFAGTMKKQAT